MNANLLNLGASLILAATLVVGCSDAVVDPTTDSATTTASYDAYDATILDEALLVKGGEVPADAVALLADSTGADTCTAPDSLHRRPRPDGGREGGRGGCHGDGRHDDGRHGGRGRGHDGGIGNIAPLGIRNYRQAASQLGLSAEQDSLLKVYLGDLRSCAEAAAAPYRAARKQAFDSFRPRVDAIRAEVRAGTMTREEAKTQLDAIRAEFEALIAPINEQLRTAVTSCRATFEAAFEATLTPEQLALWLTLKG